MKQEQVINLAMHGKNIFLTGQAGTGKTYTLNKIIDKLKRSGKAVAVTSSTGISATHINGQTIHSWSGIGIRKELQKPDDLYKLKNSKFVRDRIYYTEVLIIDEISMLHDYRFDMVEEICRFIKNPTKIFGDIQVIVCGDFHQLPPVEKGSDKKHYCFNAVSWNECEFKVCYLDYIYRQDDTIFIDLLNNIRKNSITSEQKKILDNLSNNYNHTKEAVNLYCKNYNVDTYNALELSKIDEEMRIFKMTEDGIDFKIKSLKDNCLALDTLFLKKGAKVMVIANISKTVVNGTMGKVINFEDDLITIEEYKTGNEISISKWKWELEEWDPNKKEYKKLASITQFPLKLAFSVTIHKSQGATFDYVNLDLKDTFVQNMGYVALSRVTSLEGMYLAGYNNIALQVDDYIIEKDREFQNKSKEIEERVYTPLLSEKSI